MEKRKQYGLLGKNISYSLSPIMHNAAFKHFGINAEYKIIDKNENEIKALIRELSEGRYSGINVTVPYKIVICGILEKEQNSFLDDAAQELGAVNTIKVEEGGMRGYNTDGKGFCESVMEGDCLSASDLAEKKIFVIGAGGASRAICFYLARVIKPAGIYVYDIDESKLKSLVKDFEDTFDEGILIPVLEEDILKKVKEVGLLVNATPLGTKECDPIPINTDFLHKGLMVYDLVYARETALIKAAKEKGIKTSGGIGMLVNQAALAFAIWTEEEFAIEDIRKVMKNALPKEMKRTYGWNTL